MIKKLIGVGKQFVMLVHSFLTNRSHYLNVSAVCLPLVSISTGPPRVCVVTSLVSGIQYTNSYRSAYSNNHYFLCADDVALVGLLSDNETDYRSDIAHFVSWCVANCLELNVIKTKEIIIDF